MSKVIKASRITGEYKLSDIKIDKRINKKIKNSYQTEFNTKNESNQKEKIEKTEEVKDAESDVEKIVAEAEKKAVEIVKEAEEKAENLKEKAEKKGYDSGYQTGEKDGYEEGHSKGYDEGLGEFKEKLNQLDSILNKTRFHFEKEIERLPGEVIDLSVEVASRIVNKEIDLEPELINNIIFDILEDIGNAHEEITIKISPDMIDYINEVDIESSLGDHSLEFVADGKLGPGDCVVETEFGGKDATIENKLDLIEKKLYQGAEYHEEG